MGSLDARSQLPDQFGKYTVVGHLATGGMAEVYLARAAGLQGFEKLVVLKRVRPDVSTEETTESFLAEARLVATLEHPNIAHVHEIGSVNGSYFFVMEYVSGGDLRQLMHRAVDTGRRIALADAIYIIIQVCEALHYAHDKQDLDGHALGIIHRDVSPSNVLLSHEGAVKVCDFGVAKATNRGTETKGGTLKGKYAYMSPEQCRGRPLDRRSDVFSIGILLYELTTLQQLFTADSEFDLLCKIVELPIPTPSGLVANYPPELERIVMRALAKDREARYPTAQALQLDLEEFAREHKLALSSVSVAKLMADLFERRQTPMPRRADIGSGTTPPAFFAMGSDDHDSFSVVTEPNAPVPVASSPASAIDPRRRGAPAWLLVGAVVAGLAAGGATLANSAITAAADKEIAAAFDGDAQRLSSAIDAAVRAVRLRAESIATAPMLRAAIETDAATMKDLAHTEYIFSPSQDETIEIFQGSAATLTSVLRVPDRVRPIRPPSGHDAEVTFADDKLALVDAAVISGYSGKGGGLVAIRTTVDLSAATRSLAGRAASAALVGPAARLELVPKRDVKAGPARTIDVYRSASGVLALVVTPITSVAAPWLIPVRFGCLAFAALLAVVYGFALLRARRA